MDCGDIRQILSDSFEWAIPNITDKMIARDCSYYSPCFELGGREWRIVASKLDSEYDEASFLFYLQCKMRLEDESVTATYKFVFRDLDGEDFLPSCTFTDEFRHGRCKGSPFSLRTSTILKFARHTGRPNYDVSLHLMIEFQVYPDGCQSSDKNTSEVVQQVQPKAFDSPKIAPEAISKQQPTFPSVTTTDEETSEAVQQGVPQACDSSKVAPEEIFKQPPTFPCVTDGTHKLADDLKVMYLTGHDCDVTFKVNGRVFRAHKVILKARSSVFFKMFGQDVAANSNDIIDIDDFDHEVFHSFLIYLYTGRLENLAWDCVLEFQRISIKYKVQGITSALLKFLKKSVDN